MPDGHGLRSRTRDKFSKGYRQNGVVPTTDILRTFKVGDYVDIKVNSAVHGGMPHKFYHGRTGVVWNITKRAVGVEVNKEVRCSSKISIAGLQNARCTMQTAPSHSLLSSGHAWERKSAFCLRNLTKPAELCSFICVCHVRPAALLRGSVAA